MSHVTTATNHSLDLLKSRHGEGKEVKHLYAQVGQSATNGQHFYSAAAAVLPSQKKQIWRHVWAFFFMEASLLLLWVAYRAVVHAPVWFDEGVAKAIVFGLPVAWLASRSRFIANEIGLDVNKVWPGLFLGLAIGGLYGFVGIFAQVVVGGRSVVAAPFYATGQFWEMGALALLTAWWESLFFIGLPVQYLRSQVPWLSESIMAAAIAVIFLLFHAPLRLLVAGVGWPFVVQMGVLTLFVLGQFIIYIRTKNMYAIVLSHAIWGLVIELYSR
jgi:hypothetical protein